MSKPIRVQISGDFALFTRMELKTERFSYSVITPSAARGILDAVYYHPGILWVIDRILVQKPIRFTNVRRNEVSSKILASNILSLMNGSNSPSYISTSDDIQQRASTVLRDVSYVVEAHFELLPQKMAPTDSADKFFAIIMRRLQKGQNFMQPYLGCREFPAKVTLCTEDEPPVDKSLLGRHDLGLMLYDMDYSDPSRFTPTFFHAVMENGWIDLRGIEVLR